MHAPSPRPDSAKWWGSVFIHVCVVDSEFLTRTRGVWAAVSIFVTSEWMYIGTPSAP
jgi:hypothetical protein